MCVTQFNQFILKIHHHHNAFIFFQLFLKLAVLELHTPVGLGTDEGVGVESHQYYNIHVFVLHIHVMRLKLDYYT